MKKPSVTQVVQHVRIVAALGSNALRSTIVSVSSGSLDGRWPELCSVVSSLLKGGCAVAAPTPSSPRAHFPKACPHTYLHMGTRHIPAKYPCGTLLQLCDGMPTLLNSLEQAYSRVHSVVAEASAPVQNFLVEHRCKRSWAHQSRPALGIASIWNHKRK